MERKELLLRQSMWMKGANSPIILSSRVRLARNLENCPFPHLLSREIIGEVEQMLAYALAKVNVDGVPLEYLPLSNLSSIEKGVLIEKHLISPALVSGNIHRGVALSQDHRVSVMVNEEDHLRIQVLLPGASLSEAYQLASKVDDDLEAHLDFAFREAHGYLTACPTNVGTGLRASVMVHLPALSMTNQIQQILGTLTHLGLAVRGLYGEGTNAQGHIFQISNQITLGKSEEDIITHLEAVASQIVEHELQARETLRFQGNRMVEDKVWRARGILQNARLLASDEATHLLSIDWMGVNMGILPRGKENFVTLLVNSQPNCLQYNLNQELDAVNRDEQRAGLIRQAMKFTQ